MIDFDPFKFGVSRVKTFRFETRCFLILPGVKHGRAGRQRVRVGQAGAGRDKSLLGHWGGQALVAVCLLESLLPLCLQAVSLLAESLGNTLSEL